MELEVCQKVIDNMARVIVGKRDCLELLLVSLLADGHVLLEDVPGLGKTLIAKTLARSIGGTFKRVQFTPDLLPSDVTKQLAHSVLSHRLILKDAERMRGTTVDHVLNQVLETTAVPLPLE